MARNRKTVGLTQLVDFANKILAQPGMTPEYRSGLCVMIEHAMMSADNYGGFSYLTQHELGPNDRPGRRWGPNREMPAYEEMFRDVDDTRRHYHLVKRS